MAKLYFRYAAMNAGKSTLLLQVAHNYQERSIDSLLFTARIDTRYEQGMITSRVGLHRPAQMFDATTDFEASFQLAKLDRPYGCILVDEAQFLNEAQVRQLHRLAALEGIPVICYGLRTDFQSNAFPGSAALLMLADTLEEIKTICDCGKKATMNMRIDGDGRPVMSGAQVEIGGNNRYRSMCPSCYYSQTGLAT